MRWKEKTQPWNLILLNIKWEKREEKKKNLINNFIYICFCLFFVVVVVVYGAIHQFSIPIHQCLSFVLVFLFRLWQTQKINVFQKSYKYGILTKGEAKLCVTLDKIRINHIKMKEFFLVRLLFKTPLSTMNSVCW